MNLKLKAQLKALQDDYDISIGDLEDRDEDDTHINTYVLNEKGSVSQICIRKDDLFDFTFLECFPDLTEIILIESKNLIIESLSSIEQIRELHISACPDLNLTGLENFEHIESLSLSLCDLDHIPSLKKLKNLRSLDVSFNKITNISFLEGLDNLCNLDLSHNKISCITGLKANTKIRELDISGNKIENFDALSELKALTSFHMDLNRPTLLNLDWLRALCTLESLTLAHNRISSVLGLRELTNLKKLSFQNNFISDINQLNEELKEMKEVEKYVSGNIDKWDGIGYFEYMDSHYIPR